MTKDDLTGFIFWYLYWPDEKIQVQVIEESKESGFWFCKNLSDLEAPEKILLEEDIIVSHKRLNSIFGESV